MAETLSNRVVGYFKLDEKQRQAAVERQRDVVVTAGAGSGKTRTLVARYAALLAEKVDPRRIIAITFTDKAALEMRSRAREAVADFARAAEDPTEKAFWNQLLDRMDAARISTIASLSLEILRAHPAEAGLDPKASLMGEGNISVLQLQVVEDTLNQLAVDSKFRLLFEVLSVKNTEKILRCLLKYRLDADGLFRDPGKATRMLAAHYAAVMQDTKITECVDWVRDTPIHIIAEDAGDKLVEKFGNWLAHWQAAGAELNSGNLFGCINAWILAREAIKGNAGKRDGVGFAVKGKIMAYFNSSIVPLYRDDDTKVSDLPNKEIELRYAAVMELVAEAFYKLQDAYQQEKARRRLLDFDDLEGGVVELLQNEDIRAKWQSEVSAVLVDEFQDTNARQREIVEALTGDPGKLFIVGDARQSIYRFRRADVTVFRNMKSEKEGRGGLGVSLDVTYRTHEPLLLAAGEILASIMGTQPDPQRPYYEPFAPMQASRLEPLKDILPPHIEILIGLAEETKKSRPLSAELLVQRLLAFKEEGQIASWDEVALLFRSKTAYEEYEDALEAADIPFVTVAGRGFYSRPEIRDVLNILRALSDPADDLALAGLLRSPAFGVSDDGLYQLRFRGEEILAYRAALKENLDGLSPQDSQHAQRAGEFLAYFWPLVDRVPVADLLKQVVDWLNYRAILAAPEGGAASGRLWRNLDKLMRDAYKSQLVNVRDFLDYLKALDDVGAREGEAATEAEGAVSLMTIHASKGLEFKVVVLADASNDGSNSIDPVLLPSIGAAVKSEPTSLEFYLAKTIEKLEDETERNRLLYVALTRAEEKLIICGHANQREKLKSMGWLGDVLGALGANTEKFPQDELMDGDKLKENPCGLTAKLAIVTEETKPVQKKFEGTRGVPQQTNHAPIYRSLLREEPADVVDGKQADEPARGRVTGDAQAIDPLILGSMVHKAVELNLSLTDPTLNAVLETVALDRGLAEVKQKDHAITRARELLERLQSHPFWQQLSQAEEAHHEIPFSIFTAGRYQNGIIDLLYRTAGKWHVVDFKSDSIKNDGEKAKLINRYRLQVGAYCTAVQEQLGAAPAGHLCFLDDQGHVTIVDV